MKDTMQLSLISKASLSIFKYQQDRPFVAGQFTREVPANCLE